MDKKMKLYISIFALAIIWIVYADVTKKNPINWYPSFAAKDKIPYGTFVLRTELESLFSTTEIRDVQISPYVKLKDSTLKGTYLFINDYINFGEEEFNSLLQFVDRGNDVFIATNGANIDSLQLETKNIETNEFNELIQLELENPNLDATKINFENKILKLGFKKFDTLSTEVLGKINVFDIDGNLEEEQVNFIRYNAGKGNFYFHLFPHAFTNFTVLKDNNHKYVASVLSYIDESKPILWDAYYKNGKSKITSPMYYILSSESLKWAYYVGLLGILLFILFQGKRNQRIIPISIPLKNQSIAFARTIASMYYEKSDHKSIANQKIIYFLDYIRTELLISTSVIDDQFFENIVAKTGNKKETIETLFQKIEIIQSQKDPLYQVSKDQLIGLNNLIEEFKRKYEAQ